MKMLITGSFEKARLYIEQHSKPSADQDLQRRLRHPGPCVTISRETGAGADQVSAKLADIMTARNKEGDFQWGVFDRNLIEKVIEDHNLPKQLHDYVEERKFHHINNMLEELLGVHPPAWLIVKKTVQTILQIASMGNVIIVGRGSTFATAGLKNSFQIRLVSGIEHRIKHIMELFDMNRNEAADYIKKEDAERRSFVQTYFHKDVTDPQNYQMVLNTGLLGYQETAEIIGDAVTRKFMLKKPKEAAHIE